MDYTKFDYSVINDFFPKGMLSIIAGRPAIGKTAFVNHVAQALSQHGERVLYFCLEPFTTEQNERLNKSNLLPHIVTIPAVSIGEVQYLVNQGKWKYDAIIIDYVQLMDFIRDNNCISRDEELKAIWHALDDLAVSKNLRVIGVSQLDRMSIDGSEEGIPENSMDYMDRDFLAKRLKVIHRPSYYIKERDSSCILPIELIDYTIDNKPLVYGIHYY